ncbi:unnamed protein product [Closterium sp. NIES-64]|nr:unnamed protein product [Closterium sp. NIES-64]
MTTRRPEPLVDTAALTKDLPTKEQQGQVSSKAAIDYDNPQTEPLVDTAALTKDLPTKDLWSSRGRIARGADTRTSVGDHWRGRRGGLPFARIRCLSGPNAERADLLEKEQADRNRSWRGVIRGGRIRATEQVAILGIAKRRERTAHRKQAIVVAKIGVAGEAWRDYFRAERETLNAGGEGEDDAADTSQESERDDVAEAGDEVRKEDAGGQRDMPVEATEADPAPGEAEKAGRRGGRAELVADKAREGRRTFPAQPAYGGEQGCDGAALATIRVNSMTESGEAVRARQICTRVVTRGEETDRVRLIRVRHRDGRAGRRVALAGSTSAS